MLLLGRELIVYVKGWNASYLLRMNNMRIMCKSFLTVLLTMLTLSAATPLFAQERGKAAYYSRKTTGKRTASGERFNSDSMVCAHRKHPFGTRLKVTRTDNGKSVIVRVIDRGPFGKGMIVDLSWKAAQALGMISKGVAPVVVTPVK